MKKHPSKKHAQQHKFPAATLALYGPTDQFATKIVVGIVPDESCEVTLLHKWFSLSGDIRDDASIQDEIKQFLTEQKVRSVICADRIIGCPHEEGIDYPEGTECPRCPFWAGRDRFTGELKK